MLKEIEAGRLVKEVCKAKYGGMEPPDIKRPKELDDENRRLKPMYADLGPQHRILKDIVENEL